jgi:hypothetical protein
MISVFPIVKISFICGSIPTALVYGIDLSVYTIFQSRVSLKPIGPIEPRGSVIYSWLFKYT